MQHLMLDRLIGWWRTVKRQRIPRAYAWWRATYPDLAFPAGWALITLSAFQKNTRAWEASTGIFLMVYVLIKALPAYYAAKAASAQRKRDVQGSK